MRVNSRWLRLLAVLLVSCCLYFSTSALAAAKKAPPAATGTVNTEYFSINPPPGWIMPDNIQKRDISTSVAFANMQTGIAVTFNVLKADLKPEVVATNTANNMKKDGLATSKPALVNGLYMFTMEGQKNGHKMKGQAWFGSTGKLCGATVILGGEPQAANELLRALRPKFKGLFPTNVK